LSVPVPTLFATPTAQARTQKLTDLSHVHLVALAGLARPHSNASSMETGMIQLCSEMMEPRKIITICIAKRLERTRGGVGV